MDMLANKLIAKLFFTWLFLSFVIVFSLSHVKKPEYEPAATRKLIEGNAETPFQYRYLLPFIIKYSSEKIGIRALSGESLEWICIFSDMLFTGLLFIVLWTYLKCCNVTIKLRVIGMFFLSYSLAFTYLVPYHLSIYNIYDIPSVYFMTTGLLLIYKRKMMLFYPVFILATFNRETTCFLSLAYLFVHARTFNLFSPTFYTKNQRVIWNVLAQATLWFAVKILLANQFDFPNDNIRFDFAFLRNLKFLVLWPFKPKMFLEMAQIFVSGAYLWIPVILKWNTISEPFIKRSLLVIPVYLFGMLLVGSLAEIRIYGELIPFIIPAALFILKGYAKSSFFSLS
ncbi:MAG: hypothetical protein GF398_21415 [Chitinivibrionales bacterium]|nr:hypothetical protein [Chitinivibrionales bacterium]